MQSCSGWDTTSASVNRNSANSGEEGMLLSFLQRLSAHFEFDFLFAAVRPESYRMA